MSKIYKSKSGREFEVVKINTSASSNGVVRWTVAEFDWIKSQNLKPEYYNCIHDLKLENHAYSPIPEKEISQAAALAYKYSQEIISKLKFGDVQKEVIPETIEVPKSED